ncbi:ubiquitin like 3 isoform X3 [Ptiloglossa arizonensis]|uniref:ubiquitin like 3 isoform X3 n=1 Tax=Ptiloglossa arizonensis TaxID=3350558 RepID=UPI003F9FF789
METATDRAIKYYRRYIDRENERDGGGATLRRPSVIELYSGIETKRLVRRRSVQFNMDVIVPRRTAGLLRTILEWLHALWKTPFTSLDANLHNKCRIRV